MSEEVNDEEHLREYLLGELKEAEQQALEQRLMADTELFDLLQVAEDELVDDYVSGALTASEEGRFDGFFLSTSERRRKLSFAMALRTYITEKAGVVEVPASERETAKPSPRISAGPSSVIGRATWWNRAFSSPYLRIAAAAVIVLAVGLGTWRAYMYVRQRQVSKGMLALREAYPDQRPTEARITELNYAPPPPTTRGPERDKLDYVSLDRAKALIQLEANEHPSAQSYHDLGRLYLAERDFDKAMDQFEKSLKLDEKNAELHSDYGASLLEVGKANQSKGESGKSLEELAKGLEHLNRAIELDGSLLEALFNRALCNQYLMLPHQAEDDWRKYLEKDHSTKWADEARQNLRTLENQKQKTAQIKETVLQDFLNAYQVGDDEKAWDAFSGGRTRTGNSIAESLLDGYITLQKQGKLDDSDDKLRLLSYAGRLEADRADDFYTSDQVRFYISAMQNQRETIAQAHRLMKSAQDRANQSKIEDAIAIYSEAEQMFERLGDGCDAKYLDYRMALCYLRKPDVEKGLSILRRLAQICEDAKYKCLLARVYNALADAHDSLSEYSKAIDYCNQSLEISKQIEDTSGQARGSIQMAILYQNIGDHRKSLNYVQRSFDLAKAKALDATQIWVIYDVAAEVFTSMNLYHAALGYQREAMIVAREMGIPLNLSRCYSHLGLIYGRLNNPEEAIKNVQAAFEIGEGLSDESVGKDMMASAALRLGHLYRRIGDFARANSLYDKNLELYDELRVQAESYEAHKGKLYCYLAQGEDASAEIELQITLHLIEEYRSKIIEDSNRNEFFDNEQDVYDLAIDFAYSKKADPVAAFDYSEASRARSLLDLDNPASEVIIQRDGPNLRLPFVSQPLKLAEIQKRLPNQVQIVQYAVLTSKIIIWVVSKEKIATVSVEMDANQIVERVDAYRQAILRPSDPEDNSLLYAKRLFDDLIKPVASSLDKKKHICIVPDKTLNYVPFAALVSSASGNYLAQDYTLETCPSSTIFIRCSDVARAKNGIKAERVLSVGAPRFDASIFPSLQGLPSSGTEAKEIASLYQRALALTGEDARERQVKSEMARSDVIHLASHYVTDETSPLLSELLLAREEPVEAESRKSDGLLQAYEIYGMKLLRARLVVLSACQTGIERSYRGEGAIGIARSFIKAGAPLVVASLWPVETDATSELMIEFHKRRRLGGLSTAEALRSAQLVMLNHPDRRFREPYYWAAFVLIGGYASF